MTAITRTRKIFALLPNNPYSQVSDENRTKPKYKGNVAAKCKQNECDNSEYYYETENYETTKSTTLFEQEQAISGYYEIFPKDNQRTSEHPMTFDESYSDKHSKPTAYVTPIKRIFQTQTKNVEEVYYHATNVSEDNVDNSSLNNNSSHISYFSDSGSDYVPSDTESETSITSSSNSEIIQPLRSPSRVTEVAHVPGGGDESTPHVMVRGARKTSVGKRVRDKRHACYFCHKLLLNMARHFEIMHGKEIEVSKILAFPKNSKQRKDEWAALIKAGDFYHNTEVLASKTGELILVRRPSAAEIKTVVFSDYGPCPKCLGFLIKKQLWHHLKYTCREKKISDEDCRNKRFCLIESNSILNGILSNEFPAEFHNNIIDKLRNDSVANTCRSDDLIMRFGSFLYEKYSDTQQEYIRQSMRQLGRLVIELSNENIKSLNEALVPEKFDAVIRATKMLCISFQGGTVHRPEFKIPSLALKIGYALNKCIGIERGKALRSGNLRKDKSLVSFQMLLQLEWQIKISSNALATLHRRKLNSKQLLPLTSDVVKLSQFLETEIKFETSSLLAQPTLPVWTKLASLTLSRIVLFNKRRSGEASKMTVEQYTSRAQWDDAGCEAIQECLSPFEKHLAKKLTLVEIFGKRGRKVPMLLTKEMKESVDALIKTRTACGIAHNNPYLFAASGGSVSHIRGHDALRKWCIEAQLISPESITGTKLRKYVATVCQVFNLTENQQDWIARHLGHNITVHRDFYRLHENAVELAKVSRLLIAIDEGKAKNFAGKSLDQIGVDDFLDLEEEDDNNRDECGNSDIESEEETCLDNEKPESGRPESGKPSKLQSRRIVKNTSVRKAWSTEEIQIVLNKFRVKIKYQQLPGKAECEMLLQEHPDKFKTRKWSDIKFYVKNHISKLKKQKK